MDLRNNTALTPVESGFPITAVTLDLSNACNLNCEYCFAHCFDQNYEKSHLSWETAQKAVDWLFNPNTRGNTGKVEITFWGGEPLLRWDMLQRVVLYAEERAKEHKIEVSFGGTTNVVLLTPDKFDFLDQHNIHFLLSCDGIKEHHDQFRKFPNGKGSWEIVDRNLTEVLTRWPDSEVRLSFTAENLDGFRDDMDYFYDKGFRSIVYSPVSEGDWTDERIEKLHEIWADIAQWFSIRWACDNRLSLKFLKDACQQLNGKPVGDNAPCGAGRGYCGIAIDGSLFYCHRFHKMNDERPWYEKEECMGHLDYGILNQEGRKPFMDWTPLRDCPESCKDCRAFRVSCTGGCWATNHDLNGNISIPPRINCETSLATLEQADIVLTTLGPEYLNHVLPPRGNQLPEVQGCQCFNVQDNLFGRFQMNKNEPYTCLCNMTTYGVPPMALNSCTCYNVENAGRGLFDQSGLQCTQFATSPLKKAKEYLDQLIQKGEPIGEGPLEELDGLLDALSDLRA